MTTDTKEPWLEPLRAMFRARMSPPFATPETVVQGGFLARWNERSDKEAEALARAAYAELERQGLIRTPGTVEVCRNCGTAWPPDRCDYPRDITGEAWETPCPLKGAP